MWILGTTKLENYNVIKMQKGINIIRNFQERFITKYIYLSFLEHVSN